MALGWPSYPDHWLGFVEQGQKNAESTATKSGKII